LKAGAKSKHVSYLGDAVIGAKSNIGAGTIIANYDGFNKLETTIGEGVFVGSNATIVAPRTIGDGSLIGAGSVVIEDVPDDAIYIERSEPDIYKEAAKDYRARKRKQ
jgi:bifunctional UDP-N-acetylglucosamine pyrophosphorylase/glucosamine-1-phosphate N-acetyltransferase